MFLDLCNKSPPQTHGALPAEPDLLGPDTGSDGAAGAVAFHSKTPVAWEDLLGFTPLTPVFFLLLFCAAPPPPAHLQLQPAHNSTHPQSVPTPHQWPYLPNKPRAFKTAAHSGGEIGGSRRARGRAKREGRGWVRDGSAGFPLNCPTWLSVPGLNKHRHFLLAAHVDTQTQAGTHENG